MSFKSSAIAVVFLSTTLSAAPVPKELKVANTPTGTWQLMQPDPQKPGQFLPSNQFWIIDAEYGVIFNGAPTPVAGAKPTEVFKCDPATMELDHYYPNNANRNYMGRYELRGDLLIFCLDLQKNATRPKTATEAGKNIWYLQRVRDAK